MSWRRRRTRRAIKVAIPLAIAAAVALLPPSIWRDAGAAIHVQSTSLHDLVRPAAVRGAAWLDHALRDPVSAVEGLFLAAPESGKKAPRVRILRGTAALSGPARAVDGDTLQLGSVRIRLHGIDAPESAQNCRAGGRLWACGQAATRALAGLVRGKRVACEQRERDRYGRIVAVCAVAGRDLNASMVAEGWAFAYRRYSRAYVTEETRARAARRGIWRGEAVAPWDWRRGKRLAGARAPARRGGSRCNIKGNIGSSGKRIYHVPGGRYYGRTRIDTSRGERWFCTEGEARAAGWLRSRR